MERIALSVLLIGVLLLSACGTPTTETETPSVPETEEPTFTAYSLSISISPSGAGSVAPLDGQHEEGTRVTLTATPASDYTFDYWNGDASGTSPIVTVTIDSDKSVTAHFKEKEVATYSLSVSVQPSGSGSVTPSSGDYLAGTDVTLVAIAAPGYEFDHWTGDASGTSPTITIAMDSDKSAVAYFADITPPVISGVDISHITESSTTINWATDEPATSQVKYGTSDAYGSTTLLDDSLTTSHSVTLTQLKPKTTYHFRIRAVDEAGNEALSEDYTFTTKTTKELLSATLYPAITIGSRVHELGFNLFNGSSQMITVSRAEFSDKNGNITHTISAADITRIWQTGDVETGGSFSGSISFGIPPTTEEIEGWQVKWYCLDANGVQFTVKGEYSSLP